MTPAPGPPVCLHCGMTDPPPFQPCTYGMDHNIGTSHPLACPWCGRLDAVCAERPCTPEPGRLP